ncbi:hypothetical protein [Marinobacter sp.]|uniref:hypothetical protein n=1 Tax=Marinobacter sp. TaxID=50741 RepID=UPI0035690692
MSNDPLRRLGKGLVLVVAFFMAVFMIFLLMPAVLSLLLQSDNPILWESWLSDTQAMVGWSLMAVVTWLNKPWQYLG